MEGRKTGRVEDWKGGRLEDWKIGRLVGWEIGDWKTGELGEGFVRLKSLVHVGGNKPTASFAPRGLPNPRFGRKRPGFANPWRANNYASIYADMY